MAAYDNTYSRVVAWLKIVLPLAALALMSTVFLVARTIDPAQTLPTADIDPSELAREGRLGAPRYSGVTEDGAAIAFTARSARPDIAEQTGISTGDGLEARLDLPSGTRIELSAGAGVIDTGEGTAAMSGGVAVQTSQGYRMQTDSVETLLDRTRLESGGAVAGQGPIGTLEAGAMELTATQGGESHVLVFKEGVKLVYEPGN